MTRKINDYSGRIIIALDTPTENEALALINRLENQVKFVKIGMELFYGTGFKFIEKIKSLGLKVFLDLKMHDIPNTVAGASAQLTRLEVDMFNLHAAGGLKMMEAAAESVTKVLTAGQEKPLLIAVTQLTSTDEKMLRDEIGINLSMEDSVLNYAKMTKKAGLDGVVSSPLEVKKIKENIGRDFLTVTPGIRPKGTSTDDQKRVTTPKEAFELGSDFIVIGRAVTKVKEPAKVIENIIDDLKNT